jgi:hypothetical protein
MCLSVFHLNIQMIVINIINIFFINFVLPGLLFLSNLQGGWDGTKNRESGTCYTNTDSTQGNNNKLPAESEKHQSQKPMTRSLELLFCKAENHGRRLTMHAWAYWPVYIPFLFDVQHYHHAQVQCQSCHSHGCKWKLVFIVCLWTQDKLGYYCISRKITFGIKSWVSYCLISFSVRSPK